MRLPPQGKSKLEKTIVPWTEYRLSCRAFVTIGDINEDRGRKLVAELGWFVLDAALWCHGEMA